MCVAVANYSSYLSGNEIKTEFVAGNLQRMTPTAYAQDLTRFLKAHFPDAVIGVTWKTEQAPAAEHPHITTSATVDGQLDSDLLCWVEELIDLNTYNFDEDEDS